LSRQFLAIVCLLSSAGICAPTLDRLCESKVDIPWAVFSKTGQGWRVDKLQQPVPRIFGGLAVGDLIQRVGKNDLTHADAISASWLLQHWRCSGRGPWSNVIAESLPSRGNPRFRLGYPLFLLLKEAMGFP